ncbi:LysR family transcriptional regulator [Duganella sp. FT134W]|uniref:LysR family transcriptional regulator n=1 Tax=Duganella margarita TaxID=2692170 RepID=A0A7X4H054_9BURK|nr:LysR family transcriptional regulator [Duganella margarita]MYM72455.1 LysR family transcriptional regulator [Duganella margarita]
MIDALQCFVAVVELRSLSKAAAHLEFAVSSVSRKIDALEAELGARLLLRRSRQLIVTDAGERFLPRARNILAELEEGKSAVQELDSEPRGLLTVTAPAAFGRLHVAPAIAAFLQRHPLIEVDLHTSDEVVDLAARRVDVAVRAGVLPASDLVAVRLAGLNRVVAASPAYLARHGWPKKPEDLLDHQCLTVSGRLPPRGWWRFDGINGGQPLAVRGKLRCDDTDSLLHAAISGAGIVHLANWLTSDAIVAGQLVPVFPMDPIERSTIEPRRDPGESAIHAVHMPGRSNQAKAQLLIRHLKEYFGSPPYWDLAMEAAGAGERHAP